MHMPSSPATSNASSSQQQPQQQQQAGPPCECDYDVNALTNTDKVLKETREAGLFTDKKK
jgi:hypothetical protein